MSGPFATTTGAVSDPALQRRLWQVYDSAFKAAEEQCIQAQSCYDQAAFVAALEDAFYMKFVLTNGSDGLGVILATNDLEKAKIAYVNPVRLRNLYPQEAAEGRIWYVTVLAIVPEAQGQGLSPILFDAFAAFIDANAGVIAFDYSEDKIPGFPRYAVGLLEASQKRLGLSTDKANWRSLGGQTYGVITLAKT